MLQLKPRVPAELPGLARGLAIDGWRPIPRHNRRLRVPGCTALRVPAHPVELALWR